MAQVTERGARDGRRGRTGPPITGIAMGRIANALRQRLCWREGRDNGGFVRGLVGRTCWPWPRVWFAQVVQSFGLHPTCRVMSWVDAFDAPGGFAELYRFCCLGPEQVMGAQAFRLQAGADDFDFVGGAGEDFLGGDGEAGGAFVGGAQRADFGFSAGEDEAPQVAPVEGGGAHRAGFGAGVEGAVFEFRPGEFGGGGAQGEHFGMGGPVADLGGGDGAGFGDDGA